MPYRRFERQIAAALDSMPRLRAIAKAGYQRVNYLVHGWSGGRLRLHPLATLHRIAVAGAKGEPRDAECFFGYFGLQPWSRDGRRHLFHRRRDPASPEVEICVHDLESGATAPLGASRAWNFQQGTMAQWLELDGQEWLAFNDVADRRLVCRLLRRDGHERRVDWPLQALRPGSPEALSLNYRRLARLRPEYGYGPAVENFSPDQPLDRDGLWRVDLLAGSAQLVVTLRELADALPPAEAGRAEHKVNHAVYSPDGRRFVFMHRWLGARGKFSRLYCANADGSGLRLLLDQRMVSHYAWQDDDRLLVFARTQEEGDRYYLLNASGGRPEPCCPGTLERFGDGHPSYSPDRQWIVTDTYPDRARMRRLLLCHPGSGAVILAGAFHSPWRYDGPGRCDLHPRWNRHGTAVSIDSAHEGRRGVYAIDVAPLLDAGS